MYLIYLVLNLLSITSYNLVSVKRVLSILLSLSVHVVTDKYIYCLVLLSREKERDRSADVLTG